MRPKTLKRVLGGRQLFRTYCRFIIQEQWVSGRSMLCQSVLKHLRHSGSVMKSVKKRGIWQNVLRTLFYHKCFVSQSFLHGFSLTRNLSEYLMAFLPILREWGFTETVQGLLIEIMLFVPQVRFFFERFKCNNVVNLYFINNPYLSHVMFRLCVY